MANWFTKLMQPKLAEEELKLPPGVRPARAMQPVGSSGTTIYSGYFSEEYLQALTGRPAADVYDEMRRGDSRVKMILSAVKNPIRCGVWEVHPCDADDETQEEIAEFVKHVLFEEQTKTFKELLSELLSVIDFGHSVFELIDNVKENKEYGTHNTVEMHFRSQRTLERWDINRETGQLNALEQNAYGDLQRSIFIPADRLMVISLDKEGDNYEGISGLRACYGAWARKKLYLKLMAIGIERNAVPTPAVKFPSGFQGQTDEFNALKENLKALTSHQQNYFLYPNSLEIDFNQNDFHPEKVQQAIDFENKEMTFSFLANFLELGSNGGGGSYALSFDLSDFFLGGLEHIAELICEQINRKVVKRIVDLNFGPQEKYPRLCCSGIADKAGKEYAEILAGLANSGYVVPDINTEKQLRKRLGLPEISEEVELEREQQKEAMQKNLTNGQENDDPNAEDKGGGQKGGNGSKEKESAKKLSEVKKKSSEDCLLAERNAKKLITSARDRLTTLMRESITDIADQFVQDLAMAYRNATPATRLNAYKKISPKGRAAYIAELKSWLAEIADKALVEVRKEIPKARNIKLADFDDLPKKVQKRILAQSQLIVDTQLGDLEKDLYFKFTSNAENSLGSDQVFEGALQEAADSYVDSGKIQLAATNASSEVVNEARSAFFFDDDVLEEIESFTFVNGNPISDICQDLAGRTFAKDDPEAEQYFPPLHHNCKSYLVPNLKGTNKKISENGLEPSTAELKKSIKF